MYNSWSTKCVTLLSNRSWYSNCCCNPKQYLIIINKTNEIKNIGNNEELSAMTINDQLLKWFWIFIQKTSCRKKITYELVPLSKPLEYYSILMKVTSYIVQYLMVSKKKAIFFFIQDESISSILQIASDDNTTEDKAS